jgi:hypothetical protein
VSKNGLKKAVQLQLVFGSGDHAYLEVKIGLGTIDEILADARGEGDAVSDAEDHHRRP